MIPANFARALSPLLQRRTLLFALCWLAYLLRLLNLDAQSFWYDEGFSAWLSAQPLEQITARTAADIHPPLYYYILHFWIRVFGQSEFALRFPSLMAGVLLAPLTFHMARRLFDQTTGWIAAVLAAAAPMYLWYSQEARMYMLVTFLTLLSTYLFWRWLDRLGWRLWLAFTLCNLLAIYLHFYAFFIVAFQLIYFFFWWVRQETRWDILLAALGSAGLIVAAYVPWMRFALGRFVADESYFEGTLSLGEVLRKAFMLFSVGHTTLEPEAFLPALGFGALVVVGWFAAARLRRDPAQTQIQNPFYAPVSAGVVARLFLLLYLTVPFALLYLISYARPKFHPRYLMIASPPFFIFIAAALALFILSFWRSRQQAGARRRYLSLSLAAVFTCFVASVIIGSAVNLYTDSRFSKDDFRSAIRTIAANRKADETTVLVSGHMFPVYAYYDPRGQYVPLPDAPTLSTQRVLGYNVANDLNRALNGKGGVWLMLWQNEVVDPGGFVTTILDTQAQRMPDAHSFWGVRLLHYRIPPGVVFSDKPQIQTAREVNFGGQIQLLGYNTPPSPSPADKGISLTLYWRALETLSRDYQVSLRVLDAESHLVGKLDARPATYNYPTTRWQKGDVLFGNFTIPLEPGTPPGQYQVDVTLYAAEGLEALDVLDVAGNPAGKTTTLQAIDVERAVVQPLLEKIKPRRAMRYNVAGVLDLVGYEMDRGHAEPGEPINITLYWRATGAPKDDYRLLFLVARSGAPDESFTGDAPVPLASSYPTSQWRAGDIIRGQYTFFVPTDAASGARAVRMNIVDRNNKNVGASVSLGEILVDPSTRLFRPPTPRVTDVSRFGGSITLYGYDIAPNPVMTTTVVGRVTLSPSDTLRVNLWWRSLQRVRSAYNVFVHVRRQGAPILTQHDSPPAGGVRPTATWVPGEYILDTHELRIPRDAAPGEYFIEVGLYDPRSGQRLPIQNNVTAARLGVRVLVR